jgi:light-regulated signal transduction histidine kinase (bacteriophytochrome)
LQRGYRSLAAVPIREADHVIGALTVHAGEPHQFDVDEESLLIEIGQTISYALDGLAHEAQRRRAEANLHQLNLELEQRVAQRTAELNFLNEQLRAKNDELKGFAYTVSHDLKAPLRGISGYAQELERRHRAGLSDRAQFCLTQIVTATRNLDHLIEDLLHYSRLDTDMSPPTNVNLRAMIDALLHDRARLIEEQGTQVEIDLATDEVFAWERGLLQAVTNLIDNALKYSRKATPPRVVIRGERLAQSYRLSVTDNGVGFDMKYHDRIFGLFNRLVRADEFEGTGAGLAIAKKAIEKQAGKLWAQSQPGAGATFYIDLPAAPASRQTFSPRTDL